MQESNNNVSPVARRRPKVSVETTRRVNLAATTLIAMTHELGMPGMLTAQQLFTLHAARPTAVTDAFNAVARKRNWSEAYQRMMRVRMRMAMRAMARHLDAVLPTKVRWLKNTSPSDASDLDPAACLPIAVCQLGTTHWLYCLLETVHRRILMDKSVHSRCTARQYNCCALMFLTKLFQHEPKALHQLSLEEFQAHLSSISSTSRLVDAFQQIMISERHSITAGRSTCNTTNIAVLRTRKSVCNTVCVVLLPDMPRPAIGKHVATDLLRSTVADPHTNKLLRASHQVHHFLTESEETAVHAMCTTPLQRVVFRILFTTGMRISAFCNIRMDGIITNWTPDMSVTESSILDAGVTIEKNNLIFSFVIFPAAKASILEWLRSEQRAASPLGPYLVNSPQIPHSRCSTGHIRNTFTRVCVAALGDKPGLTPHIARHTVAERLYQAGNSVSTIARYLRHSEDICSSVYLRRGITDDIASMKFPWR